MHLIVTGASGFIGRNVLLGSPRDWSIVAVSRHASSLGPFVREHGLKQVKLVDCDLTCDEDVRSLARLTGPKVDAVLYLAANGDPAASAVRPGWDLNANTAGLVTFLENIAARRFVFASSGAVYDGADGAVTPATPVSPTLPYAISKLASEQYVRFFAERRRTLDSYATVRFFGAYGPHEPDRKITTRWARAALDGSRDFAIRGDGRNLIDFMHVDDAVRGFLALVAADEVRGTMDFAAGAPMTILEVTEAMASAAGASLRVVHQGETEEYIRFRSVDDTMRTRVGFSPAIDFRSGFSRLYRVLAAAARTA